MKHQFILILIFLLLCNSPMQAQQANQSFTLKEAILYAFENNNEIKSFEYLVSAGKSDIKIQKSALLPKLKCEEGFMSTNNPTEALALRLNQRAATAQTLNLSNLNNPVQAPNWLTAIYLEQPLYDKKLYVTLDMSKIEYNAEMLEYVRKKEKLAYNVALAFFDVERDRQIVEALKKDVANSQENLDTANKMYAKQKAFYSAVLRAETDLTEIQQRLVSAQKSFDISKRALGLALGETIPIEINMANLPIMDLKKSDYYDLSSQSRTDIKSSELKYEKAKKNVKLAESAYYPSLSLASSYRAYDPDNPFGWQGNNYYVGSFLRWDLYDGAKRKNEKLKAKSLENGAFENLQSLKKQVSFDVYSAITRVEESTQNLELAKSAYKSSEEGRKIVLEKYQSGELKFTDLLDVQRHLSYSRVDIIIQENNRIDSLVNLCYESGTILRDFEL